MLILPSYDAKHPGGAVPIETIALPFVDHVSSRRNAMRHYPTDSPRAAARIVVMSLIADGHIGSAEIEELERRGFYARLGLHAGELHEVVREVCEDLTRCSFLTWDDACRVDPRVMQRLAEEVRDERMRRDVLTLCESAVVADGVMTCTEAAVIDAVKHAWRVH
jgi:hypothetical protein